MFDFAWSELALIAVVALIAIGPKDMPAAIRAVTGWVKKARRMAAEFQTHVDEMVREADLSEIRSSINEIRNFDIRGEIERTVDADGSIRATFASNPLESAASATAATSVNENRSGRAGDRTGTAFAGRTCSPTSPLHTGCACFRAA